MSGVTFARELQNDLGLPMHTNKARRCLDNWKNARRTQFISDVNKKEKILFAKSLEHHSLAYRNRVISTDDCMFETFGYHGPKRYGARNENGSPTSKHGSRSVMVSRCISDTVGTNLEFVAGIVDANYYLDILKRNLFCKWIYFRICF